MDSNPESRIPLCEFNVQNVNTDYWWVSNKKDLKFESYRETFKYQDLSDEWLFFEIHLIWICRVSRHVLILSCINMYFPPGDIHTNVIFQNKHLIFNKQFTQYVERNVYNIMHLWYQIQEQYRFIERDALVYIPLNMKNELMTCSH